MIFLKKCLGCPPFLGYICWPKVVGALCSCRPSLSYFLSGVPAWLPYFIVQRTLVFLRLFDDQFTSLKGAGFTSILLIFTSIITGCNCILYLVIDLCFSIWTCLFCYQCTGPNEWMYFGPIWHDNSQLTIVRKMILCGCQKCRKLWYLSPNVV